MKKSMKLWMVLAIVVLLAVAVPSLVFLPGCNIRDDDSTTTDINKGTVVGKVTDAGTGNGIENVTVTIVEQSAKAVISDETDTDGNYSLPNVAPGTQTITAKKSGYANYSTTVEVTANTTVTQDFSMNAVIASTVTGNVRSSADDAPLVGVKVWIDDIQDFSDSTGSYTLNGVSAGTVVLRASLSSYADYQLTLIITEDTTVNQNVDMDEDNAPDPPQEDKANIYGRVTAAYKPVADAKVELFSLDEKNNRQVPPEPEPSPSPTPVVPPVETDSNGLYEFINVDPGNYRIEVTAEGYPKKTENVTVKADENYRADTISLAGGPSPSPSVSPTGSPTSSPTPGQIATYLISKRKSGTAPTQNTINSINGKTDNNGRYVVFQSNDHLITAHSSVTTQIYMYDRTSSTLTVISTKGSTMGDADSMNAYISPDGKFVAFASDSTNLLVEGDANSKRDIFLYKNSAEPTLTRLSTQPGDKKVGGNGDSDFPCLSNSNDNGFYCVYETVATDVIAPSEIAGNKNVYRTKIGADNKAESIILVSRQFGATNNTGGNAASGTPHICEDGGYVAYESLASDVVNGVNPAGVTQIFRYDVSANPLDNRNSLVSSDNGALAPANATKPCISNDGAYVSYMVAASAWGHAGRSDCFRRKMNETGNDLVSGIQTGFGDAANPTMTSDGSYVVFQTDGNGYNEPGNNNSIDCIVRDMSKQPNDSTGYTCVSVGEGNPGTAADDTSGKVNTGSVNPYISRTGSYVVFQSSAANLVSGINLLGTDNYAIYLRKWK